MSKRPPGAEDWTLPRSSIDGVVWPPLPPPEAVRLLALEQQLDESQWWPVEVLRAHQLRQLKPLLEHAATLPFYRKRLDAAGIDPGAALTWEGFAQIPLLTRRDVQAHGARLRSDRYPKMHGGTVEIRTCGAIAMPATFQLSAVSVAISEAFALRGHEWRGERLGGKLAVILDFGVPAGARSPPKNAPNWGRPIAAVYPTGPASLLGIGADTAQQVEWLRREKPEILVTPASNLLALALHRGAHGTSLRSLRPIGETVTPEIRAACQAAWNLEPVADYTAKEVGVITLPCPEARQYHVQSEAMLVEVLRDDDRPCVPGEVGRVVVTPLHNLAMPLLRYAIGDHAEVGMPCACGRGLPTLARILGRTRDLLRSSSGEHRFALQASRVLRDVPGVRQFQIWQPEPSRLELRLHVVPAYEPDREAELREAIVARTGRDFEIGFSYDSRIERSRDSLFKEFARAEP